MLANTADEYIDINFTKVGMEGTNVLTCVAYNNTDETYKSVGETIYIIDEEPVTMADANINYNFVSSPSTISVSLPPLETSLGNTSSDGSFEEYASTAFTRDSKGNIYYANADDSGKWTINKVTSNGVELKTEEIFSNSGFTSDKIPTEIAYDEADECIWIASNKNYIYMLDSGKNFGALGNLSSLTGVSINQITALYAKDRKLYIGAIDEDLLKPVLIIYDTTEGTETETITSEFDEDTSTYTFGGVTLTSAAPAQNNETEDDTSFISDIAVADGNLYVLLKERVFYKVRSTSYEEPVYDDVTFDAFKGALLVSDAEVLNDFTVYFRAEGARPSDEIEAKSTLLGPDKFLAVMPKKLVISDEGLPEYVFPYVQSYTTKEGINRVVEVNLETMALSENYDAPPEFSEAIKIGEGNGHISTYEYYSKK